MSLPNNLSDLVSNETRLQWWSNNLSIANVILVAMTLIVTFFTYLVGTWLSKATEERTKKEKSISDEKIAQSYSQAKNASATAENAKLEQQKVTVELKIEQRALAGAQNSLAVSQKNLADAQRKQAQAELALQNKLEEIRNKQLPRVLSIQQQETLTDLLTKAPKGKIGIDIKSTDDEIYAYGNQIVKCFKAAGWSVSDSTVFHVMATGGGTDGIIITVNNTKNQPPARATALAFRQLGIKFKVDIDTSFSPDYFEIFIGNKP